MNRVIIQPRAGTRGLGLRELARARELLVFLVWREIRVRYAHTTLGILWTVIQPVATMALFTVVFARMAGDAALGVPYPLFVLIGLVAWSYVSGAVSGAAESLIGNPTLVTKVYFPRLAIPMAPVGAGLVDFGVAVLLLVGALLYYRITPPFPRVLLFVPVTALLILATSGIGVFLSALNLRYRDARYAIPFALQLWFFASPIAYALASLNPRYRPLFLLNPLSGIIEGFRAALVPGMSVPWSHLGVSAVVSTLLFVAGTRYFRATERTFADLA